MVKLSFHHKGKSYSNFTIGDIENLILSKEITQQEANEIIFTSSISQKLIEINLSCELELGAFTETYPAGEVSTFDKQETEARAYLADNAADTPFLDALTAGRGIDKVELINRVIAKADVFSAASGEIIGKRQKLEDQLNSFTFENNTIEDIAAITW